MQKINRNRHKAAIADPSKIGHHTASFTGVATTCTNTNIVKTYKKMCLLTTLLLILPIVLQSRKRVKIEYQKARHLLQFQMIWGW